MNAANAANNAMNGTTTTTTTMTTSSRLTDTDMDVEHSDSSNGVVSNGTSTNGTCMNGNSQPDPDREDMGKFPARGGQRDFRIGQEDIF